MNAHFRNFALWVIIALLLIALFQLFQSPAQQGATNDIAYSDFMKRLEAVSHVKQVKDLRF